MTVCSTVLCHDVNVSCILYSIWYVKVKEIHVGVGGSKYFVCLPAACSLCQSVYDKRALCRGRHLAGLEQRNPERRISDRPEPYPCELNHFLAENVDR